MASNYDIAFLRVLMQQSLAEKSQAMRCIQVIDEQAQRGQPVSAMQVVVRLGLCDARQAERVDAMTRDELQRTGATPTSLATQSVRGNLMQSAFGPSPPSSSGAVARPPSGPPGPPPPLPGASATTQSGVGLVRPASPLGSQTLPPGYLNAKGPPLPGAVTSSGLTPRPMQTSGAHGALASPPSGGYPAVPPPTGGFAAVPPPRPSSAPPPTPPPPRATGSFRAVPPTSTSGRLLTGEETMAGADRRLATEGAAAGDEFYDLAENGQGLDDFTSGPKVGRGPVGTSYTGRRKSDGAQVVVKVLSRRFDQHPDLLAQVLEDVGAWARFRHPNATGTLGVGVSNGRHVIVFEAARGTSVEAHLREKGRLEPRMAMRVIYDVAQALAAGQERGLAHGDVRAAKVFFDGQRAAVADLGLSRASCLAAGFGQHGMFFGHPSYLAPEVLQERLERPTPATDVYALGVLFYELVCGVLPFQGDVVEVLGKHFDAPLPPPPPGVTFSAAIAGLMLRMTAKSPSQRLPDARAVVQAVTNLLEGKPLGPLPGQKPRSAGPAGGISADDWGRVSQREEIKGTSNNWTVSKIEQAPALGPADLLEAAPLSEIQSSGLRTTSSVTSSATSRYRATQSLDPVDEVAAIAQSPGGPQVGSKLGRGPVGTSYDGGLPGHPGAVVVKVLSKKFSKHPDLVRRIVDAVKAGARVDNPGVVRALKALQIAGRDMIVFEKAGGRTLREVLARGPLPWRQATARLLELARTLEAARRAGVSHGDIRPEKIFVEEGGRARLADFGLAEASALGGGYGAAGVPFGHPVYLAPEVVQERRREPDERGDIYSLGILFYELLCGRPPFHGGDARRTLVMHFEEPIPPPPDSVTVPLPIAELILRMTAKDPARRLMSMADLVARLQEAEGAASRDSQEGPASSEARVPAPSGTGMLEYDPGADEMVDPDAWGEQSLGLSKPSGEWAKEKITEAPKVGPEEWTPDASENPDEQSEPPRKAPAAAAAPAAKQAPAPAPTKTGLEAAIEAAAATRESTPEAQAVSESATRGKRKAVTASASGGGPRKAAAAPGGAKEGGSKGLVVAVVGIVAVLGVMGGLFLTRDKKPVVVDGGTERGTEAPDPPVRTEEDPAVRQRQEQLKRLEREVTTLSTDVEDLIRSQRFKDAAERLATLSPDARKEASLKATVQGLEDRLQQGVAERLARESGEIDRLVAAQQFEQAERSAAQIATWAPDPASAQAAVARVREARVAFDKPVAELDAGEPLDGTTEATLSERLQGWRGVGRLFQKGGVTLGWKQPETLLADLQVMGGKATVEAAPDGRPALRIVGTKDAPALVAIKLPLKRIVDASVDLVLTRDPGPAGQVALIMGVRPPAQVRGFGAAWGTVPVELVSVRDRLKTIRTTPSATLPLQQPVRLRLVMSGSVRLDMQGRVRVGEEEKLGPTVPVDASRTAGRLALWVEDAEVWVTSLELRGLLDPTGLR